MFEEFWGFDRHTTYAKSAPISEVMVTKENHLCLAFKVFKACRDLPRYGRSIYIYLYIYTYTLTYKYIHFFFSLLILQPQIITTYVVHIFVQYTQVCYICMIINVYINREICIVQWENAGQADSWLNHDHRRIQPERLNRVSWGVQLKKTRLVGGLELFLIFPYIGNNHPN